MNENLQKWLDGKKDRVKNKVLQLDDILSLLDCVKKLIFPEYALEQIEYSTVLEVLTQDMKQMLETIGNLSEVELDNERIIHSFINELPKIDAVLQTDIDAIYEGDPAATNKHEIILCYPGLTAIFVYRIAHALYRLQVPILPRALSEYAHSKTGIDIHPGADIDCSFFIDHGTGIVIGETCKIGKRVKIYQGVTLGALSLKEGQKLKGVKRHPTIEDDVTIYSGASIFGGDTVIGKYTTIGSNAFITSSIEEHSVVTIQGQKKKHNRGDL